MCQALGTGMRWWTRQPQTSSPWKLSSEVETNLNKRTCQPVGRWGWTNTYWVCMWKNEACSQRPSTSLMRIRAHGNWSHVGLNKRSNGILNIPGQLPCPQSLGRPLWRGPSFLVFWVPLLPAPLQHPDFSKWLMCVSWWVLNIIKGEVTSKPESRE